MANGSVNVRPTDPTMDLKDRLELRDLIVRGGTGDIRDARDANLLRNFVQKELRKEEAKNKDARRLLIEEAQITAQLEHPHIVPVHELGLDLDDNLYFTMKRVRGSTLNQIVKEQDLENRTDQALYELLHILVKISEAVAFAHSRGVIHRDIKPGNIMVGEFGQAYLMDWGASMLKQRTGPVAGEPPVREDPRSSRHNLTTTKGMIFGTPAYMAPEQTTAVDELIGERTDVFLLGGVLYKILTGLPPHTGDTTKELVLKARKCEVPPPQEVVDHHIYPKLREIAMKAMAKTPEDRYATALEFKTELEGFLRGDWRFERRVFEPDSLIIRQGEPGDRAYIIKEGSCLVFKKDKGVEIFLDELGEGEVFGETAVFTDRPRTASVRAITQVTVLVVNRQHFREHFEQELGMGYWVGLFVKALSDRLKEKDERVTELEGQLRESGYPVPL